MRKLLIFFFTSLIFTVSAHGVSAATLDFSTDSSSYNVGDTGEVRITLDSKGQDIIGASVVIELSGNSVQFSSPLNGSGKDTPLDDFYVITNNSSRIEFNILSDSVIGNGVIAILPFTVNSSGTTTLSILKTDGFDQSALSSIDFSTNYLENTDSISLSSSTSGGPTPTPTPTPTPVINTPTPTPTPTPSPTASITPFPPSITPSPVPTPTPTPSINVAVTPTISFIAEQNINEGDSVTVNFTVSDPDTSTSLLTLSGISSDQEVLPNSNITFGGSGSYRSVTLNPRDGEHGKITVSLTVSDGTNSSSRSFILDIDDPTTTVDDDDDTDTGNGTTTTPGSNIGGGNVPTNNTPYNNLGGSSPVPTNAAVPTTGTTTSVSLIILVSSILVSVGFALRKKIV